MQTAMQAKGNRVTLSFDIVESESVMTNCQKAPIIFLHGVTSSKEEWNHIIRPIANATGRKAYAYDFRNHGDSGWSDDMSLDLMKEDLLQFMDDVNVKKAVLVGHSMGGKTAMLFATRWPERVEKLIVEEMSPKPLSDVLQEVAVKYVHSMKHAVEEIPLDTNDLKEAKKFVYEFLRQKMSKDNVNSRKKEVDLSGIPLYQDENGKYKWKANLEAMDENFLRHVTASTVVGTYSGPTLLLHGTESIFNLPADIDYIRAMFPDCRLRAVEEATHLIHREFEDVFIKEVSDFINES